VVGRGVLGCVDTVPHAGARGAGAVLWIDNEHDNEYGDKDRDEHPDGSVKAG